MIEKFKQPDGSYLDEHEVYFEDAEAILGHRNGFCGCGDPAEALRYLHGALQLVNELQRVGHTAMWLERRDAHFKSEGAEYFMWYYLNRMDLTEHGTAVPGWLSPKGVEMLKDLTAWLAEQAGVQGGAK